MRLICPLRSGALHLENGFQIRYTQLRPVEKFGPEEVAGAARVIGDPSRPQLQRLGELAERGIGRRYTSKRVQTRQLVDVSQTVIQIRVGGGRVTSYQPFEKFYRAVKVLRFALVPMHRLSAKYGNPPVFAAELQVIRVAQQCCFQQVESFVPILSREFLHAFIESLNARWCGRIRCEREEEPGQNETFG